MTARDTACRLISLGRVQALEAAGLCVVATAALEALELRAVRNEADRAQAGVLAAELERLRERVALLEAASLDLAGVALDRRAPGDKSTRGVRP